MGDEVYDRLPNQRVLMEQYVADLRSYRYYSSRDTLTRIDKAKDDAIIKLIRENKALKEQLAHVQAANGISPSRGDS